MGPVAEGATAEAALGQSEPAAAPSDQDGFVFDLGTGYGVDLETTEQSPGIKRSGLRPQSLTRGGACAPGAVHGQGGASDRLHAWVVDSRLGVAGVCGQERCLGWPDLGAVRHGSGEPLPDAVDTFRVLYLAGELLHTCRDRANRGGGAGVISRTADCCYVLLEGTRREQGPGFRRRGPWMSGAASTVTLTWSSRMIKATRGS